ncbi:helix-turn-helix domain-containing protein [Nonomuraea sp. NPDC049419]|uniref:helix-turn-helix domain-containing protein n=1 Tax=Nonomuraea sp. NPDC049419 TaxID=3155772 RepID=UPI00344490F0
MSETWTIGELAEHAARALRDGAAAAGHAANGRVRDVPGERLIRWYTTIGLLDPPLTRRGRIARYGRRHLLQLVAVKRMQAAGHSIAEIQTALTGATDHTLEQASGLNGSLPRPDPAPAVAGDGERARFWAERPGSPPEGSAAGADGPGPAAGVVTGIRLGDGVRLVLDGRRALSDEDVQAVLAAAGPLLAVLEERKLT